MRSVSSLLVAFAVVWALAFLPRVAWAQSSVTGIIGAVQRCEPPINTACASADNTGTDPHPSGVLVNALNFEDCSADLHYEFQLGIASPNSSYNLQVWAGTQDCSQLTNRQTSATSVCWPVISPTPALTTPFVIDVRMQDIASGVFTTTHPVSYVATTDPSVCQAQTQTGATTLTLYFFFTDGASNPVGTVQQYPLHYDTRAGDVQGNITVGVGDTVLIVNIPPTTDPDTQGWNIYCDPPPGQEGATETVPVDAASNNGQCTSGATDSSAAGATDALASTTDALASSDASSEGGAADSSTTVVVPNDDAGGNPCGVSLNDSGIPSPGGCSQSSVLVPGNTSNGGTVAVTDEAGVTTYVEAGSTTTTVAQEGGVAVSGGNMVLALQSGRSLGGKYLCGQGGATSTSINVTGLLDGHYYNIAVAATDAAGNVGPLSNVPCGEPVPVADFWRVYYEAGGRAGGGFCATEGVGVPAGTSGLGVLMVASIVGIIRRRRRA